MWYFENKRWRDRHDRHVEDTVRQDPVTQPVTLAPVAAAVPVAPAPVAVASADIPAPAAFSWPESMAAPTPPPVVVDNILHNDVYDAIEADFKDVDTLARGYIIS